MWNDVVNGYFIEWIFIENFCVLGIVLIVEEIVINIVKFFFCLRKEIIFGEGR